MAFRGRHSPEARAKMSIGQKAALNDPAILAKRIAAVAAARQARVNTGQVLSDSEVALIAITLRTTRQPIEKIARDWLVGYKVIWNIKKKLGIERPRAGDA